MVDRTSAPDYKPPLPAPVRTGSAQVAQLVEHATENRSVGGSIPPLGTMAFLLLKADTQIRLRSARVKQRADFVNSGRRVGTCKSCARMRWGVRRLMGYPIARNEC